MIISPEHELGRLAYEADLKRNPNYHNGTPRPSWDAIGEVAKWSWSRGPRYFAMSECGEAALAIWRERERAGYNMPQPGQDRDRAPIACPIRHEDDARRSVRHYMPSETSHQVVDNVAEELFRLAQRSEGRE